MAELYISYSFARSIHPNYTRELDTTIAKLCSAFNINFYDGPGWGDRNEKILQGSDILLLVPPEHSSDVFSRGKLPIGRGQYNEIRKFYDITKGGYKAIFVYLGNGYISEITSCTQITSSLQNDKVYYAMLEFTTPAVQRLDITERLLNVVRAYASIRSGSKVKSSTKEISDEEKVSIAPTFRKLSLLIASR